MSNYPRDKRRSWPVRAVRAAAALVPAAALALGSGLAVTAAHAADDGPTMSVNPDRKWYSAASPANDLSILIHNPTDQTLINLRITCGDAEKDMADIAPTQSGRETLAVAATEDDLAQAERKVDCTLTGAASPSGERINLEASVDLTNASNGIEFGKPAASFTTREDFDKLAFTVANKGSETLKGYEVTFGPEGAEPVSVPDVEAGKEVEVKLPESWFDKAVAAGSLAYTATLVDGVPKDLLKVEGILVHSAISVAIDPAWAENNKSFAKQSDVLAPKFVITNNTDQPLVGAKLNVPELTAVDPKKQDVEVPEVAPDGGTQVVTAPASTLPDNAFFDGKWDFTAIVRTGNDVHGTSTPHVMTRLKEGPQLGLTTRVVDADGKEIAKPGYKTLGQKVAVEASFTNSGNADAFVVAHTTPSFTMDGVKQDPANGNSLVGMVPAGTTATLKTFHYVTQPEDLAPEVESIAPAITYWDNALGKGENPPSAATTMTKGTAITTDPIDLDDIQVTTVPQEVTVKYSVTNTTDQVFTSVLPSSDLVEITGKPATVKPRETKKIEVSFTVNDALIAKMEDGKLSIPTYLQVTQEPIKAEPGPKRFAAATTVVGALLPMPGTTAPDPNSFRISSQTLDIPVNLSPAPNPNPGSTTSKGSTAKTGAQVAAVGAIAAMSLALGASLIYRGRRRDV